MYPPQLLAAKTRKTLWGILIFIQACNNDYVELPEVDDNFERIQKTNYFTEDLKSVDDTTSDLGQRRASETPLLTLADQVPSFAGYYCESGNLIVLDTMSTGTAVELVPDIVVDSCRIHHSRREVQSENTRPDVIERLARYTFLELHHWRDILSPIFLDLNGAIGTYIDYRSNRLVLTGSMASLEIGESLAAARSIPIEALSLEPSSELSDDFACTSAPTSLASCFGPIPGGVRFYYTDNGSQTGGSWCTMGPAATRLTSGFFENGWVVNSHCVPRIFRLDSDWIWQPGNTSPKLAADFIGFEAVDPPGWTCGSRECRYSDSAWITALPQSTVQVPERGKIVHARWNSLSINPLFPRYTVVGSRAAVVGMTVHKVGAATGHSRANVSVVCGDFNRTSGGRALRMICQDRAPYIRGDGDSGSPVFFVRSDGDADIVGVHWGADFDGSGIGIYSPWDGILADLGPYISPVAP